MTLSLAYNHYKQFGADHFIKVLLHELAHHIQYIRSKKIEHDTEFKDICLALGGIMNEQLAQGKYRPCLSYKFIDTPNKYKYTCTGCGNIFYTKRKMDPKRICLKCGTSVSKFKLKELIKK
jgi:predicted SprT family Zn-dependent metalloprotease